MAKGIAQCTCRKCGKEFEKINRGCRNRADAEQWEEWARKTYDLCPECWKAEQDEARRERTKDFPELTGSPRQIAWAEKLRDGWAAKCKKLDLNELGLGFVQWVITTQTESKFWIEHLGVVDDLSLVLPTEYTRKLIEKYQNIK